MDLKNKVILITGAGKGAGAALAKAFAERGALVALNDISPINVEQVTAEITAKGGKARSYIEDIAKKVGVQYVIKGVEDDFGGIDVLVNHAAVAPAAAQRSWPMRASRSWAAPFGPVTGASWPSPGEAAPRSQPAA